MLGSSWRSMAGLVRRVPVTYRVLQHKRLSPPEKGLRYARAQVDMISSVQEVLSLPQLSINVISRITGVGLLRDQS